MTLPSEGANPQLTLGFERALGSDSTCVVPTVDELSERPVLIPAHSTLRLSHELARSVAATSAWLSDRRWEKSHPNLGRIVIRSSVRNAKGARMVWGADEAVQRVQDDVRRALQRAERYPALQSTIDGVRGKATSIRRDLSVEVDAAGVLRDIRIGDSALDRGGDRLAAEIFELMGKATRQARADTLAATTEIMGEDDPIVKTIAADLEARNAGDELGRSGGIQ